MGEAEIKDVNGANKISEDLSNSLIATKAKKVVKEILLYRRILLDMYAVFETADTKSTDFLNRLNNNVKSVYDFDLFGTIINDTDVLNLISNNVLAICIMSLLKNHVELDKIDTERIVQNIFTISAKITDENKLASLNQVKSNASMCIEELLSIVNMKEIDDANLAKLNEAIEDLSMFYSAFFDSQIDELAIIIASSNGGDN